MAYKLRGHRELVLTIAVTADGQILTGGEEGEIIRWSPNGGLLQRHIIETGDVTSIAVSTLNKNIIYVASTDRIHVIDLENLAGPPLKTYAVNQDEINQLTLNEAENFLASCDDSGQIKIINLQDGTVFKTLRKHTNICSTVRFRPRKPWELISGAYDSNIMHWDFARGRYKNKIDMVELGHDEGPSGSAYLLNPPFVHSVDVNTEGTYMACGTENALVHVFDASKRNLRYMSTLHGHSQGVSQVHFPAFSDSILISGGNDGNIVIWDVKECETNALQAQANGHGPVANGNAANGVNGHAANGAVANGYNGHVANGDGAAANHNLPEQVHHAGDPLKFIITHGGKINWISSMVSGSTKLILVADNSNEVTIYPIAL